MWVPERKQQHANLFEGELAPRLAALRVELGYHGIQLIDGGGIRHERPV
jgi:hypothetical protein